MLVHKVPHQGFNNHVWVESQPDIHGLTNQLKHQPQEVSLYEQCSILQIPKGRSDAAPHFGLQGQEETGNVVQPEGPSVPTAERYPLTACLIP